MRNQFLTTHSISESADLLLNNAPAFLTRFALHILAIFFNTLTTEFLTFFCHQQNQANYVKNLQQNLFHLDQKDEY